jgi:hypothetical protein
MTVTLGPELESILLELARKQGVEAQDLVVKALRERFLAEPPVVTSDEEWERLLGSAVSDCGVSLSHEALSSEGLYD